MGSETENTRKNNNGSMKLKNKNSAENQIKDDLKCKIDTQQFHKFVKKKLCSKIVSFKCIG